MATTYVLKMKFKDEYGDIINHNLNYVDPEVTSAKVNALMAEMITSGTIYDRPPYAKESAEIVETKRTSIAMS